MQGAPVAHPGPDRGMVFQEYALFPWMTVEKNIAFGLEIKGTRPREIAAKVDELLGLLRLTEFRKRFPKDLSGGMRQRVAIARVLALDPPIMLMDEPFGALDSLTRRSLQDELLRIWQSVRKTVDLRHPLHRRGDLSRHAHRRADLPAGHSEARSASGAAAPARSERRGVQPSEA